MSSFPPLNKFSVSELNKKVKQLIETEVSRVIVDGEVSDFTVASSGHWYFTLKDENAQIRCAMFRRTNLLVRSAPNQGDSVTVTGQVTIYEERGSYQLIVETLDDAGYGVLQKRFEMLKAKLAAEGMFSQHHKQPISDHNEYVGIITSTAGAAIRDIISVVERRNPTTKLYIFPVAVQGAEAPAQIITKITQANQLTLAGTLPLDLIILTRGGGSLEDLWAFNDEGVARAMFKSTVPIVSAVGHETDFGISDMVADVRAATPSAAAELVTRSTSDWLQKLDYRRTSLAYAINSKFTSALQRQRALRSRVIHPRLPLIQNQNRVRESKQRAEQSLNVKVAHLNGRYKVAKIRLYAQNPGVQLDKAKIRWAALAHRADEAVTKISVQNQAKITRLNQLLHSLSPIHTLNRGYAIVRDQEGIVVRQRAQAFSSETLDVQIADGNFKVIVDIN